MDWILQELLDTYDDFTSLYDVALSTIVVKGKKRLSYGYLNERLDDVLEKGMSQDAVKAGLSVKTEEFGRFGLFRKTSKPAVVLKGRNPRHKIFIDAEHGAEHAGPETILRVIDEWQKGKFLPEVANELEIYALPMFDSMFPDHNAYANDYGSYKKGHPGSPIAKQLKNYGDLFIFIHQTPDLENLHLIAPEYRDPFMSGVANCAEKTMKKWRETARYEERRCGQHYIYKKLNVPYLVFELNFKTYEQRVQAPDIGMDVLKAVLTEFVHEKSMGAAHG